MKSQKIYSSVKTFPEFNRKIKETEAKLITLAHIYILLAWHIHSNNIAEVL